MASMHDISVLGRREWGKSSRARTGNRQYTDPSPHPLTYSNQLAPVDNFNPNWVSTGLSASWAAQYRECCLAVTGNGLAMMPEMDGLEVLRRIRPRADPPRVSVVMHTAIHMKTKSELPQCVVPIAQNRTVF
jgi:hypothetical protein